jgi:hypothetical protein
MLAELSNRENNWSAAKTAHRASANGNSNGEEELGRAKMLGNLL